VDIYSIGLKVDSRQVKTAQKELGGMGRQAKGAGNSVQKFGRNVDKSSRNIQGMNRGLDLAKRALGGFAAALSVRQLQVFAQASLQAAQTIERQARSLGITAEEFQRISFAFRQFGADSSDISDAFNTLSDRAQDAKDGMQSFIDDFKLVGIEVDDLENKDPGELFRLFADGVASIDDPTRRAAGVVRILGDDVGRRLLPMLMDGSDGLEQLGDQADITSDEVIESSARIQEDLTQLGTSIEKGFQNAFLGAAVRNEEQIRSLIATILRGMATVADFGDEVAGPLGAGLLGRVLFGKKGAVIGTLLTSAVQTVNALIERVNETSGQAIVRLEERAQQLQNTIQGLPEIHPVRQAAEADLERVQSKLDDLNAQRMGSIEIENQYQKALKETGDVGEDIGDVLRDAAVDFEKARTGAPQAPIDIGTVTGGSGSGKTEKELKTIDSNLSSILAKIDPIAAAGQSFASDMLAVQEALDAGRISTSKAQEITEQLEEDYKKATRSARGLEGALEDIAENMTQDVSDGLTDIIMQAKSAEEVFASLAKQIARTIIQQQIADPLAGEITGFASGLFGGGGSGIGAPGSDVGSGGGFFSGIGDFFGGFFANGGNISGGKASIVGERGPEMFVPGQDGQIVPNHQLGGGGNVTVNVINQGGEQLEAQQQQTRRGPNGEMTVDVMVKSSMERLDSQGQLDGIFRRHGAQRQGQF